jgi:hypothetical protein
MRGGGGVFAIAVKTYVKAYGAFQAVNAVVGEVTANCTETYNQMISQFVENDPIYMNNFSSGLWETSFPTMVLAFQKGFQTGEEVVSGNVSLAAFDFLNSIPGVTVKLEGVQFPTWNAAYQQAVRPLVDAGDLVGVDLLLISRIVAFDLLETQTGRQSIVKFVTGLPQNQSFIFQRGV